MLITMRKILGGPVSILVVLFACFLVSTYATAAAARGGVTVPVRQRPLVRKEERSDILSTENGRISAVKISDGRFGSYHVQFITLEPNSLFLPVHLHSDMVFYVNSGNGTLSWANLGDDDTKLRRVKLQKGDVYRLKPGSFFYLQSSLVAERQKLRICAIFSDSREELLEGSSVGAYASVRDLVLGFDSRVLQAALGVPGELVEELRGGEGQPLIVPGVAGAKEDALWEANSRIMRAFLSSSSSNDNGNFENREKDTYNILKAKHDVENCNGWSLTVTKKQLDALKDSDFGVFMVNLSNGAMMGPHWNPRSAEIAVVLQGRGMVHVVCPSVANETECKNSRFRVEEGDLFVVPRYHPMAQMSFNNESFVFIGFTTTSKKSHPQFLAGKASVFTTLDKMVLATSFNVSNTTMDQLLAAQREAIILECLNCAEDEEVLMEEEIEREREEERRREEEEARKREEEERREQEEARKREEEEARAREEERRKREQEEEARRQEEEEARRQQEEEEARRQQEEEQARRQEEEEARRQEEEEARRQKEEEEARRREEEEARRQEEEEEARRQEQEEEARRQQEEEKARRQEEEQARRQEEEEARSQEEEEEARRQEAEEEARRQERGGRGGRGQGHGEGEAARRAEEEMERRQREAEEGAGRGRESKGRRGWERAGRYEDGRIRILQEEWNV